MKRRLIMGIVLAKYPPHSAGHQLSILHWLWGFSDLGWETWVVESLKSSDLVDAKGEPCALSESVQLQNWNRFVKEHDFLTRSALFVDGESPQLEGLRRFADRADLFLNYAGQFDLPEALEGVQTTAYLDVDPGYTQTWARGYGCNMNLDMHEYHITIGANYGASDCRIPDTGHDWIPTLPPISSSYYDSCTLRRRSFEPAGAWSTITHWYGAADVECEGMLLRGKRESFLPLISLPELCGRDMLVASDLHPDWEDYAAFISRGWKVTSLENPCRSLEHYLRFIRGSIGEIGVAKEGYVTARTGWLSDRSMAYLACGRPVVALDTGWSQVIGQHPGLRAFCCLEEAVQGIREIEADYETATLSALELSETLFEARNVIDKLLPRLGIPPLSQSRAWEICPC